MNKKARSLVLGAACLVLTQAVFADGLKELSYTGVEVSYGQSQLDDFDTDADGFAVAASYDVGHGVFISGGYGSAKTDPFTVLGARGSVKSDEYSVGAGYHHPLSPTVDLVPSISVIDATTDFQGGFARIPDESDTGWSAGLALRALMTPHLELAGGVDYVDLYDDGDASFHAGGTFYPVDKLGFGAQYDAADDAKTLTVIARVVLGR